MDKWNLIIDVAECQNCSNCVLAAKDELVGNDFPGYSAPHPAEGPGVIRIERSLHGEGHHVRAAYLPRLCNHCDQGPCLQAGADGSVRKREDGIVVIDPVKARGRRDLVDACPYGAIVWNEELQLPQTWFFDAHLLDAGWKEPRCATVCPTRAIEAVKTDDGTMMQRTRDEGLRVLQPELDTRPRVHYRNLHRFDRCVIAGSVVARTGGRLECAAGAQVALWRDDQQVAETRSDAFGDFRFEGLMPNAGEHELRLHRHGLGSARQSVSLGARSAVLNDIELRM
jgi:Fe-S-cluster-containing dehydrogenase component